MKTAADYRRAELRRRLARELELMRIHGLRARILRRTLREEGKGTR